MTNVPFQHIYANELKVCAVWVFLKQCSFFFFFFFGLIFTHLVFSEFVCYYILMFNLCFFPVLLFLYKRLNLCSSAAKRKRKMKKELLHTLISVSMLLLYHRIIERVFMVAAWLFSVCIYTVIYFTGRRTCMQVLHF